MPSTTITVRGFKVRSASQRRYIVIVVRPEGYDFHTQRYAPETGSFEPQTIRIKAGAFVCKRSDSIETARKHARDHNDYGVSRARSFAVVVDSTTGQEV